MRFFLLLLSVAAAAAVNITHPLNTTLPIVDLGYGVYRASSYNATTDAYTFSNIRFAAPPVGELRFSPPQPPKVNRSVVHDGSEGWICPQAEAGYLVALGGDARAVEPVSEDCLFLDVIVPRRVLNGEYGRVPVLFWVFGGAYTAGSKTSTGSPSSLLSTSPSPVIWIAPNYRLGLFGFLAGPTFALSNNTIPNAGLHDQRLALKWTQTHIHLFNGNPASVTIMGASAGAGSIMHHITAYGGRTRPLFTRAAPLGPGFFLEGGHAAAEEGYTAVETATGCTGKGVECLRSINTTTLQTINEEIVLGAKAPAIGYGPVIDGDYVPDSPAYLLALGRHVQGLEVLVADDSNEGFVFTDQKVNLTGAAGVTSIYPVLSNATIAALLGFFPPPGNGTGYTSVAGLRTELTGEVGFNCNRFAMAEAFRWRTWNLVTSIAPGYHGTGVTVLFKGGPATQVGSGVVEGLRRGVMNFVVTGDPNEVGGGILGVKWPVYGEEGVGLNVGGWNASVVDVAGDRAFCEWWAKGLVLS